VALAIFAAWFAWGLLRAIKNPRVKYVSHATLSGNLRGKSLLTVRRQQLLPPWLIREETWLVDDHGAIREGDGAQALTPDLSAVFVNGGWLFLHLIGCLRVAEAREQETEEVLSKCSTS